MQIYRALIQPHFDYCCSVWDGLGETLSCKLQKLQNRAARVILRTNYDASAGILLDTLCLDNLSLRREKHKAKLVFKIINGDMPTYLQDYFSRGLDYNIRNSEMKLNLPKPRTNYLKRSFCYSGAVLCTVAHKCNTQIYFKTHKYIFEHRKKCRNTEKNVGTQKKCRNTEKNVGTQKKMSETDKYVRAFPSTGNEIFIVNGQ